MKQFENVYKGKKIFITGHTGFKGSWLSLWLLHLGAEVAGYSIDVPTVESNFEILGLKNKMKDYRGDVRNIAALGKAIDEFRPDMIFHLAAQALVRRSYNNPVDTFETNVMGMVNIMECIRLRPWIEVAVLITSDKAYRNDEWCWGYRETDALGGHDPYSSSKSCADLIAGSYFESFIKNTPTRMAITRAGNVIGGGDWAEDRIVPDCMRAWSKNESVFLRNPLATRPWQHVLEPLSGYLWLGAGLWKKESGLNGEAFNFGPDAHVNQTVGELIEAMSVRWPGMKWDAPKNLESKVQEANLLKLSCDKALHFLKWRAALEFKDTVAFTVDWYREWHNKKVDLFEYTTGQIDQYCQKAKALNASWISE